MTGTFKDTGHLPFIYQDHTGDLDLRDRHLLDLHCGISYASHHPYMRNQITGLLILWCIGCNTFPRAVNEYPMNGYVLIDTIFEKTPIFMQYNKNSGGYPIYYIGRQLDTIAIGNRYLPWKNRVNGILSAKIGFSTKDLKITVDTVISTSIEVCSFHRSGNEIDSVVNYHAYLVDIRNRSDTAIYLGSTFDLAYLFREIKNKRGQWIKIEQTVSEMGICGTGQPHVILRAGEMILAKAVRYKGDRRAECRLVMKRGKDTVYSNVFVDYVASAVWD